jgi:hypothetical protein
LEQKRHFTGKKQQLAEYSFPCFRLKIIFVSGKNLKKMRNREHHPQIGIGLFFIVLGLALLVAKYDLLNLGSFHNYFTWQTAMIFVGVLLLVNLKFVGGILLIAGGTWFLFEDMYIVIPAYIKTIYWPAVIVLLGLGFIISSFIKRKNNII